MSVQLTSGPSGFPIRRAAPPTLVYKGMLISHQLHGFFPDLRDERFASAMALVHSRFSTNTFPSWDLAHPFRVIAHNGEINTLMGNKNWMRARESQLASELFGGDLQKVMPIVRDGGSDSATFDNVLELLMLAGRSLPHAVMMMIPEAYAGREDLPEHLKGFYAFHSTFMEPWDGPAAVCFTDGRVVGATLDRNGLRPGRWVETTDGIVALGSEAGMLSIAPERIKRLGRLAPGKLFLVDLEAGRIVDDAEVKEAVSTLKPFGDWYADQVVHFDDLPVKEPTSITRYPARIRQPLSLLMKVRRLNKDMQICEQEVGLLLVHEQCSLAGKEWVHALQCLHAVLQQFFVLSTHRSGGSGVSLLSPKS